MSSPDTFFAEFPKGTKSEILGYIYDTLDNWVLAGKMADVDSVLDRIDVNSCELVYLIGYLTITLQWKSKLSARAKFYDRVKDRILQEEPERITALLQGLK